MGMINRQAGVPAHYIGHELGIMDIFIEYSLKIPQIYSNILDISLSGGCGGLMGEASKWAVWAGRQAHKQFYLQT